MTDTSRPTPYSLAELVITAAAETWRHDGEIMATGIGPLPRLAAALAKTTFNPALQTTDGECFYTASPVPPGPATDTPPVIEGWSPYDRVFSALWGGKRHAMVAPVQMDRFGQTNISVIGDHARPKAAMLGARGFPGNSVHHPNSFFFANHTSRTFVAGEVDFVCSAGYNPARYLNGQPPRGLDLRLIVTDLAVLDFGGPGHAIQVRSLHPGVSFDQVQDNTGFPLHRLEHVATTSAPTAEQLALIRQLDPNNVRRTVFKGDPAGDRRAA
ncbi:CoA-transferase subunit beta [Nitrospirillum bahiense]|uniref:Glutaconate CoA-transferase subunit B n=1 Tax=Nitrospirillum amazonense TaxID=28077 RepID=A0A560FVK5_9PROT|nr:ketoacid CoA transferase [Nitrospirillum amazonense]TWB25678.1 glutaconate CoA-transferase subunit B [Nitrospirillum amazonense]